MFPTGHIELNPFPVVFAPGKLFIVTGFHGCRREQIELGRPLTSLHHGTAQGGPGFDLPVVCLLDAIAFVAGGAQGFAGGVPFRETSFVAGTPAREAGRE